MNVETKMSYFKYKSKKQVELKRRILWEKLLQI